MSLGSINREVERLLWGSELISQRITIFCLRGNLTLFARGTGQSFADVFFSVHLFPPCSPKSPCLLLRCDPLQWLPALKWSPSTLLILAWAIGCRYRTVLLPPLPQPLPLTTGTLLPCLTCFPTYPLPHLSPSLLQIHARIIPGLNQITHVSCSTNWLLHVSLDIGIWWCANNSSQSSLCEGSVIIPLSCRHTRLMASFSLITLLSILPLIPSLPYYCWWWTNNMRSVLNIYFSLIMLLSFQGSFCK